MHRTRPDPNLAAFLAHLQTGFETYRKGGAKKQRTGALQQLSAVISWAECTPGVAERIGPLRHLFYAIGGIDTGFRDKLLAAPPAGHRTSVAVYEQGRRGLAAAAMDRYMDAGESRKSAAQLVARGLHGTQGLDNLTGTKVVKWRELAMTESPKENFAALRFKRALNELEKRFPAEPRKAADYLIERLKAGHAG